MAITITDLGTSINVNLGTGEDDFDFPKSNSLIWLENSDGFVYFMFNTRVVIVNPALLTVPTTGVLLKATIDGYLSTGVSVTVNSTETNFGSDSVTTSVTSSATSVLLKAQNLNRKEIIIYNNSDKIMYVCYFSPATITTPFILNPTDTLIEDKYTGEIRAIWEAAPSGNALITEVSNE